MSSISPKLVTPRKHQEPHFDKIDDILKLNYFYADFSPTGFGKTFPPLFLAQKFNIPLFVVCPLTVEAKWRTVAAEYSVKVIDVITYQALRSTTGRQPKHGFLQRADNGSSSFTATDKLKTLIQDGCIFVFDEGHNLKNRSDQWKATAAITKEINETSNKSRYAVVSATLFDKEDHAVQFLELTGIKRAHFMYRYNNGNLEYEQHGLGEIINKARNYNEKKTDEILARNRLSNWTRKSENSFKGISNKVVYQLLVEVIREYIGSCIVKPINKDLKDTPLSKILNLYLIPDLSNIVSNFLFTQDKKNGYFKVSEKTAGELVQKIRGLGKAVGFNPEDNMIDPKAFGKATLFLTAIEKFKVEIFVRIAKQYLEEDKKCKVVLFLNYLENIDYVYNNLYMEYGTVKLTGASKKRGDIINKFQNDGKCRVFVGTTSCGGQGIDLDDKIGNSKRKMLISPDYSIIKAHQAVGRTDRDDTKSEPACRFVYAKIIIGNKLITELPILEAMAKKTIVFLAIASNIGNSVY